MEQSIIFFDGECNLCNKTVQWIIKSDQQNRFLLAPLQGKTAQNLLPALDPRFQQVDSFLLWEKGTMYDRSTAALRVARRLKGLWPCLAIFFLVPRFIRDAVYSFVARNRYKWFGKSVECMVPAPGIKQKFLD